MTATPAGGKMMMMLREHGLLTAAALRKFLKCQTFARQSDCHYMCYEPAARLRDTDYPHLRFACQKNSGQAAHLRCNNADI